MTLGSFVRSFIGGSIFIKQEDKTDRFSDVKVDHQLSRALYTSIPYEGQTGQNYQLGNFCTSSFIDTFAWYVGLPTIKTQDSEFNAELSSWIKRNRTVIERFIKQSMIDAKHYGWMRIEQTGDRVKIVFRQISRECVNFGECIKDDAGGFSKFVFTVIEKWGDAGTKTLTTKWTLEKGKETWVVSGDVPQGRTSGEGKTGLKSVPVFEQFNKKQSYLNDGIPEIAPAVPFIARYDAVLRKLGKHVEDGLVPRMIFIVKGMRNFLKRSFGKTDEQLDKGGVEFSAEALQNVFLEDPGDKAEYLQKEDRSESATKMLELLYYIIIELTMPEYLYGASLNSTNASVGEQSPVWAKKVAGKQGEFEEFFYWLADTFLALSNASSGLARYKAVEGVEVIWPEVSAKDDVAMMNALASLVGALDKLLSAGIIGAKTAFGAIQEYITTDGDFNAEQEAAKAYLRFKLELDNIKERHAQGDIDTGSLIEKLLGKKSA